MGKGKQKTLICVKPRPADASVDDKAEKEVKENNVAALVACQRQTTIAGCLKSPLTPVPENHCSSGTSTKPSTKVHDREGSKSVSCDSDVKKQAQSGPNSKNKKSKGRKLKGNDSEQNHKVTDFYPVRRSCRKSKSELKSEKLQRIDELITNNVEDGLKVKYVEGKGRGVFADREFQKGQFVVEYHGDLLELSDAKKRETEYAEDPTTGCYMFYFRYLHKNYCVDATKESSRLGRLINHSKNGNLQPKVHDLNGVPHLILLASKTIRLDEELLYDYGDRSKEATSAHPWLKH